MSATMATTEKQRCGYKPAATSTMLQLEMTLFCEVFLARWVDSGCGWLVASIFYKTSYLLLKGLVSHTTKKTTRVATVPKLIIDCSVTIEGRLWPLVEMTYSGFPHLGCAFWFLIPAGTNLIFRIPPDSASGRIPAGHVGIQSFQRYCTFDLNLLPGMVQAWVVHFVTPLKRK